MIGIPLRDRVVEVLCDRGTDSDDRWTVGTGFLVGGRLVLTSAHVISRGGAFTVRRVERGYPPAKAERKAQAKLVGDVSIADLGLLELDSAFGEIAPVSYAQVNRESPLAQVISGCWAVGFPQFKTLGGSAQVVRETVQVEGVIPLAEDLYSGLLTFRVTSTPRRLPPQAEALGHSQWSGMSGAAVLVGDHVVGVITEHHPRVGESALTVTPITHLTRLGPGLAQRWRNALGIDFTRLTTIRADSVGTRPEQLTAQTADTIASIIAGYRSLPTDYSARVSNFISEYLGSSRRHVPFGGRSGELAELGQWLEDPAAPPYLLLSAPAGRGKSALLAHWTQSLLSRGGISLVYFPVSIRYRTNLAGVVFPALVGRLAAMHGEKPRADSSMPAEAWRALLSDYLGRFLAEQRLVLVVIDGIDEAADWEAAPDLFPFNPPGNLRLVLAARSTADDADGRTWLHRLGWENSALARVMPLEPLGRSAVADAVLRATGSVDSWAADIDLANELYRLTAGDPLLLRLYIDRLLDSNKEDRPLTVQELRGTPPGLEGYFSRWWEDQRRLWGAGTAAAVGEVAVQAVLDLLACALGPLTKNDICHLASPDAQLNTWTLAPVIERLERLLIGDADEKGYSFCHSRLAEYFEGRLTDIDRQATRRRYLTWGDRVLTALNSGELSPDHVPSYLVQYYGAHLERWGARPGDLLRLVGGPWCQAWERLEGTQAGFLNDVARAWTAAQRANQATLDARADGSVPHLVQEIRCSLAKASIQSISGNLPPELVAALVEAGKWSPAQALAYARQQPLVEQRAATVAKLVPFLTSELVEIASSFTCTLEEDRARADGLMALAPCLTGESLARAIEAAERISEPLNQIEALIALTTNMAAERQRTIFRRALRILPSFYDWGKARIIEQLATRLPAEFLQPILEAALSVSDGADRARALHALLPILSSDILDRYPGLSDPANIAEHERPEVACILAGRLPPAEKHTVMAALLGTAATAKTEDSRTETLVKIARYLPSDLLHEALDIARSLEEYKNRGRALAEIAVALTAEDRIYVLQEILDLANELPQSTDGLFAGMRERPKIIISLAGYLTDDQVPSALGVARAMTDAESRAHTLTALLPRLSAGDHAPITQEILDAIDTLPEEQRFTGRNQRVSAIAALAKRSSPEMLDIITYRARSIKDDTKQANAQIACLKEVSAERRAKVIQRVLKAAERTEDDRAEILCGLALEASGNELSDIIPLLMATGPPARLLAKIAPFLDAGGLAAAVESAFSLEDSYDRLKALEGLAPYLEAQCENEEWLISIYTRSGRNAPLALTALAPYMSPTATEFALRLAFSVPDEKERTVVVAAFAARQEAGRWQDLVDKALEVICHDPNSVWHLEVMAVLSPHLTTAQIRNVLAMGFAEKKSVEHMRNVVHNPEFATRAMITHLRPSSLEVAFDYLSHYVSSPGDTSWLCQLLMQMAGHLPISLVGRAFELADALPPFERTRVHLAMAQHLSEAQLTDTWKTVRSGTIFRDNHAKVWGFEQLAPYLSTRQMGIALMEARRIRDDWTKERVLAALAHHVPPELIDETIDAVLTLPRTERVPEMRSPRASALEALATHAPRSALDRILEEAVRIDHARARSQVLEALRNRLIELPASDLYRVWNGILETLSSRTRADLLSDFSVLMPIISRLGGSNAAYDCTVAVTEIGAWWP